MPAWIYWKSPAPARPGKTRDANLIQLQVCHLGGGRTDCPYACHCVHQRDLPRMDHDERLSYPRWRGKWRKRIGPRHQIHNEQHQALRQFLASRRKHKPRRNVNRNAKGFVRR